MSIWAIADIHASATEPATGLPIKSMDIFGPQWSNHVDRLEASWQALVAPEDTVIVAGDIDWALHLPDAMETLLRMDAWSGRKILIRGNHDYWWSSKTTNRVRQALPPSISVLHNDAIEVEDMNVCGAKGSPVPGGADWTEENAKLLNRETQRLRTSLAARRPELPTIVALHYPPFYPSQPDTPYRQAIDGAGASACVFGHLHGRAAGSGPEGCHGQTAYLLVAADAVDFRPQRIAEGGSVVLNGRADRQRQHHGGTE
jgi:predicted phosphohydrolase